METLVKLSPNGWPGQYNAQGSYAPGLHHLILHSTRFHLPPVNLDYLHYLNSFSSKETRIQS